MSYHSCFLLLLLVPLSGCGLFLDPDPPRGAGGTDAGTGSDTGVEGDAVVDGAFDAAIDAIAVDDATMADAAPPPPVDCEVLAEGTVCGSDPRQICVGEACIVSRCGDSVIDDTVEACDDGNNLDGDGCESDCTLTCSVDSDCDDGDLCNGAETCSVGGCLDGAPPPYLTPCDVGGVAGICDEGFCRTPGCGNGFTDPGEQCDDGNFIRGDGCDPDCTYSCESAADCMATAGALCMGVTCDSTHICRPVTLPATLTCYGDSDGDGWGGAMASMMCGTSCLSGYTTRSGDCDDSDILAHPYSPTSPSPFRTLPRASGGFDYDCVRGEERGLPEGRFIACTTDPIGGTCMGAGWMGPTPVCGQPGIFVACVPDMGGSADACMARQMPGTIMPCR